MDEEGDWRNGQAGKRDIKHKVRANNCSLNWTLLSNSSTGNNISNEIVRF